jgi:signal transduction histidine kinase
MLTDERSAELKILLIEDNQFDAELLIEAVRLEVEQEIEIVWVSKLTTALEKLTESKVDVVLLDLTLPDSSGMDSLLKLRQFSTEIPIVVLTGLDNKDLALSCVKSGAQDYLVKGKTSLSSTYRVINYSVERCRADAAVKQLKLLEQREQFIAMLAHDLRSPLGGADRILSMLLDGLAGTISEKQHQLLSMVSGTNKTVLMMINNVLDAYRLEAGGEQFNLGRIDLELIISECLLDLEPISQGKNIELRVSYSLKNRVRADAIAMRRIILNLVGNALKFTPTGGRIDVVCEENEGKASIKVIDNGIGIAAEKIPYVFERFYQTESQNRSSGLGLGLYLCKHLVEAQKGSISCKSSVGEGTTFEVILPTAYKESIKALIVDDDETNRLSLQHLLERLSIESVSVSNGTDALLAASNHSFEAVFMDIQMAGLDGFLTSKAMRQAGINTPIVAYTETSDCEIEKLADTGLNDIIGKPATLARLKEIVEQWMPQPF